MSRTQIMSDWEARFSIWGASSSVSEQAKCENAERGIRKAIDASAKLSSKMTDVFTQGSYANRTNVREDSDVDVCVLYTGAFFPDYSMSDGLDDCAFGYIDGSYPYSDFKNDVEAALVSYFGKGSVARGKKAFDVHNTYRIDPDVVPCFEHQRLPPEKRKQRIAELYEPGMSRSWLCHSFTRPKNTRQWAFLKKPEMNCSRS